MDFDIDNVVFLVIVQFRPDACHDPDITFDLKKFSDSSAESSFEEFMLSQKLGVVLSYF